MAGDMFLDIEGVQGESKDEAFKNKIDIDSWSFGCTNAGSMGRGGGGGLRAAVDPGRHAHDG